MSINYYPQEPHKLRSPLLEGTQKPKGKKIIFNLREEPNIDDTLDNTLFKKKSSVVKEAPIIKKKELININSINSLETIFKIASAFITAVGGTFCLLELINIIRSFQSGSFDFGNSILFVTIAIICTICANVICIGFIHLVKTTKFIYEKALKLNS